MVQLYFCKDFSVFLNLFDDWMDCGDKDDGLYFFIVSVMVLGDYFVRFLVFVDLVEFIEGLVIYVIDGFVVIEDEILVGFC